MNNKEKQLNLIKNRIAKINENVAKEDGVLLELEVREDDCYPYAVHMKIKVRYQDAWGIYSERIRSNSFRDLKELTYFLRGLEWYFGLL